MRRGVVQLVERLPVPQVRVPSLTPFAKNYHLGWCRDFGYRGYFRYHVRLCSDTVFRNIGINSVLALLFTTYPLAPAAIASLANGAESDWLTTRIRVEGNSCLMRRAASKPFITGIVISSSTTSGLCSRTLRTASAPSEASQTISMSTCD